MPPTINAGQLLQDIQEFVSQHGPDKYVYVDNDQDKYLPVQEVFKDTIRYLVISAPDSQPDEVLFQRKVVRELHEAITIKHIEDILYKSGMESLLEHYTYLAETTGYNINSLARDIHAHLDEDFFLGLLDLKHNHNP